MKYIKKPFSNTYHIFDANDLGIGYLMFAPFKTKVIGEFNKKRYVFLKNGFWQRDYSLYDDTNKVHIANIVFHTWKRKAEITLANGEKYFCSNKNWWGTKWFVSQDEVEIVTITQTKQFWNEEGLINAKLQDSENKGLLVLIGFFVKTIYHRQAAAASAAS